ncbi:MAG: glycosyltransferase family A protein [Actinomycetota bacterium]|nr:glycosyltransferase family A protein [Actinomycetota bacterium]
MAATPIAVVVATRNRGAKLVPLLDSILANDVAEFELVIVDQSTLDDTADAVQPFLADPRIRYVRSSSVGLSCARNEGIALTSAPIVAITDDDCIVPRNWLSGMAAPFDNHARVGMVFCTVEAVPVDKPGLTPAIIFPHDQILRSPLSSWKWSVGGLNLGAGMAVRRSTFDELIGFDELLGAGARFGSCEDNDMSWRGLIAGWWTYQLAGVVVMHDGFRDLDELRELVKRDFFGVGGAIAKYLRTGRWGITWFMIGWLVRFGVVDPARDVLAGRKPTGFRRPYMLLRGLLAGLKTPMDRTNRLYVANSHRAS